jgi:hypothetical protein
MEAVLSSETSTNFYRTSLRYIPEVITLQKLVRLRILRLLKHMLLVVNMEQEFLLGGSVDPDRKQ